MSVNSKWLGSALAAATLLASGAGYRVAANALNAALSEPIRLSRPLAALPLALGPWRGSEIELPPGILNNMRVDDHVSRLYVDPQRAVQAALYVGFTGRPRTLLGHRPSVCYPSAGWLLEESATTTITSHALSAPAQADVFRGPSPGIERRLVLSYYVVNGQPTADDGSFRGLWMRDPNLRRDSQRYVAQVQIAVPIGASVEEARRVAHEFAAVSLDEILAFLPSATPTKERS